MMVTIISLQVIANLPPLRVNKSWTTIKYSEHRESELLASPQTKIEMNNTNPNITYKNATENWKTFN